MRRRVARQAWRIYRFDRMSGASTVVVLTALATWRMLTLTVVTVAVAVAVANNATKTKAWPC